MLARAGPWATEAMPTPVPLLRALIVRYRALSVQLLYLSKHSLDPLWRERHKPPTKHFKRFAKSTYLSC